MSRFWFGAFSKKKPAISPELREKRFNEAESHRREAFEESSLEQQRQFMKEEQDQWEGETRRAAEFEELMTILGTSFLQNQKSREVALQTWNSEREDLWERNEASRDTRFKLAEDTRESLFREDHERYLARSEWYANIRWQHIQRGHHTREKACQQLEKEMIDQFEIVIRFLNDTPITARHHLDSIIKRFTDQVGISSYKRTFELPGDQSPKSDIYGQNGKTDNLQIAHSHHPFGIRENFPLRFDSISPARGRSTGSKRPVSSLELYPSRPSSIVCMRRNSPTDLGDRNRCRCLSSRTCSEEPRSSTRNRPIQKSHSKSRNKSPQHIYPPTIPIVIPQPQISSVPTKSRSPSPTFPFTDYEAGNMANPAKRTPLLPQDLVGQESSSDSGADSNSARFFRDHHFQKFHFSTQEEHRTNCFGSAEDKRDRAEALRAEIFIATGRRQTQLFEASMRKYHVRQDRTRHHWKETMRSQPCTASEGHHSRIFEEHLSWIQKKDSALHDAEDNWITAHKQRIETLYSLYDRVLRRYRLFLIESGHEPSSPLSIEAQGGFFEFEHSPQAVPAPKESVSHPSSLRRRDRRSRWRSRSRRRSRSRSPQIILAPTVLAGGTAPAVGFAPQILATKNLGGSYLPLPDPPNHNYNKKQSAIKAGNDWTSAQRQRRLLFEESQKERSEIFESGMRQRRSAYEANEHRRQREFKEAQRTRKASSDKAEHDRNLKFSQDLVQLETSFRQDEERREKAFLDAEEEREYAFQLQQASRKEVFYLSQEKLQLQSFERENKRASEFDAWWKEKMAAVKIMMLREKMIHSSEEGNDHTMAKKPTSSDADQIPDP